MSDSSSDCEVYLSEVSPRDKPWDAHRSNTSAVQQIYRGTEFEPYADRMFTCSRLLDFDMVANEDGEQKLKLIAAGFCRVRMCSTCQWRRSLKWVAKSFESLTKVIEDYPKARWLFLTLTVRNCPVTELRSTINAMNAAFKRLIERKEWIAHGFIKAIEITRSKDGDAHPHFHVLVMVPPSYFKGSAYISQHRWKELWQSVLRIDYLPVVDVRTVKPKNIEGDNSPVNAMADAIRETLKYSVKPDDMVADPEWLLEITRQLHKSRAISVGGVLRKYFKFKEPKNEDMVNPEGASDEELSESNPKIRFGYRDEKKRYVKVKREGE